MFFLRQRFFVIAAMAFFFIPSSLSARVPNDDDFGSQWHLRQVNAPKAWDITTGSSDVVVAVLDTGLDLDHPDLVDNLWVNNDEIPDDGIDNDGNGYIDDRHGWDFLTNDNFPNPKFASLAEAQDRPQGVHHGTLIAGIVGASGNNGQGITGITWKVSIMPLRVVTSRGNAMLDEVLRALDYAIEKKVDVINLSFIGDFSSDLLEERLRKAYQNNIVIVAAAGNDDEHQQGTDLDAEPRYPVCHDGAEGEHIVIGVAATDTLDQKAKFSHYGKNCIDIAAPGIGLYTTTVYSPRFGFNTYYSGPWSGTSFAAPMVAGTAALLRSINKNLTPDEIRRLIVDNADSIDGVNPQYIGKLGGGRLNIGRTLAAASARLAPAFSPPSPSLPFERTSFFVAGPFAGAPPEAHILNREGETLVSWMAFDRRFRGGVRLGAGDLNGNGQAEVVVLAGKGGGPHVRIFDTNGKLLSQFFVFEKKFRGERDLAVADVDGDGISEIIVRRQKGGSAEIRVWTGKGLLLRAGTDSDRRFFDAAGDLLSTIRLFPKIWKGRVSIAVIR